VNELIQTEKYNHIWNVRKNKMDLQIINEVYTDSVYDFNKVDFKYPVKYILDIGGHIGSFSIKCAQLFPNYIIKCYEPIEENFELCKKNTELFNNITCYNKAVAGDLVPVELENFYHGENRINTGGSNYKYGEGKSCVDFIHIKKIFDEIPHVDILKIDCEGGEEAIIPHIDFSKIRGCIMIEFHIKLYGEEKFKELANIIIKNGMKEIYKFNPENWICPKMIYIK